MSLILSGNSGSLTVDSTAGITFPNGSNPQAAPSKVLQVVQGTSTTTTSTTSTSFVTTGLTASITPLFSTSKILVIVNMNSYNTDNGTNGMFSTIFRGTVSGTNLGSSAYGLHYFANASSAVALYNNVSMSILDAPTTTSSTTYTVGFRSESSGNTATAMVSGMYGVITLMEIAA
jgi:hypothetical protein